MASRSSSRATPDERPDQPIIAIPRHAWSIGLVTSASTFIFVLDSGLLSIAFPKLADDLDADRATLSWAFTGYSVVMAAIMAFAGSLADRVGRKRIYLLGLAVYSLGAVTTALAPSPAVLIVSRLVQGAGAAFLVTSALALALVAFPAERRSTALALWGVVGSLAAILAPTVGAAALDRFSWRWAFASLAVFGVAALGWGWRLIVDTTERTGGSAPDPLSVVLGAAGVALVMLAIGRGASWGWTSALTFATIVAGAALVGFVLRRSHHHPRPLVPPALARHQTYRVLTLACVIQQVGFFSYFFSLPIILTGIWEWSVLEAGYAMAVSMAVSAVVVIPAARWADHHGDAGIVVAGAAITASSALWWLATFDVDHDFVVALLPGLVLQGVGSSIVGNLTTGAALRHVPVDLMGSGNSLHQMSRRVGGAIGVAVTVALLGESSEPATLLDGARRVWVLLVAVHVVMAVLVLAAFSAPRFSATRAPARRRWGRRAHRPAR